MSYFNQESERLSYRKLTEADIPSWLEFFEDNDRLHFNGLDLSKSHEELADGWIRKQFERYEEQGLGHLAVIEKSSGKFIGMVGILPRIILGKPEYEIAYSLKPRFWGKGYGTEMARKMKEYGFGNIPTDRFISMIDKENTDSIKVARKNGMNLLFDTEYLGMEVYVFGINVNKQVEL